MGGDDSQKLLPWRGSYSSPGLSTSGFRKINTLSQGCFYVTGAPGAPGMWLARILAAYSASWCTISSAQGSAGRSSLVPAPR